MREVCQLWIDGAAYTLRVARPTVERTEFVLEHPRHSHMNISAVSTVSSDVGHIRDSEDLEALDRFLDAVFARERASILNSAKATLRGWPR